MKVIPVLFKITGADGGPVHGGTGTYPPLGRWTQDVQPCVCRAGWHLVADPLPWWRPAARLWLAEGDGQMDGDGDKGAFARMRLVEEVTREWPYLPLYERVRCFIAASERSSDAAADIRWARLAGANLALADLTGANLTGADLAEANLSGANLARANLAGADLMWANLTGADLAGANLSGANLMWANLAEAALARANLAGADLAEANLSGANLARANLSEARLADANLTGAYRHQAPAGWLVDGAGRLAVAR